MSVGEKRILTVSQLNMYVKSLLESSAFLNGITVVGEISNFKQHYSGHLYLSLKDDMGLIRAVMFRSSAVKLNFTPKDGMKVVAKGRVSLYERDGQYQFYITSMKQQGTGELTEIFEQLKQKLKDEGLFDAEKKRPIPKMPKKIAVITSPTGAAVRDIFNILSRRYPVAEVIMCPVQVQGDSAAPQMINALKLVNETTDADTIIIGRGGGSIEDLWAFNDESLARAVRASRIPVISAVGHETDFTICDFAADLRAPTPSGAAELAVPDKSELLKRLDSAKLTLRRQLNNIYEQRRLKLNALTARQCLANPLNMVEIRRQTLDRSFDKMTNATASVIAENKRKFTAIAAKIEGLSPMKVLSRGYSAVFCGDKIVSRAEDLTSGDEIKLRFADGERNAVVK